MTAAPSIRAAVELRQSVRDAGGLLNLSQLAERYGMRSRTTMVMLRRNHDAFPPALYDNGQTAVFVVAEVDAFMRQRKQQRR